LLAGEVIPDTHPQATVLADRFRTSALGKKAAHAAQSGREWDFVAEVAGTVLRGQIDLWFAAGRQLVIVDYKTDRQPGPEAIAEYSLQVQLYAIALSAWSGRDVTGGVLHFLTPDRIVDVDVSPIALGGAREAVYRLREAQERGEFPLREGAHCRVCDYWGGACPAGRASAAGATGAASLHEIAAAPPAEP
jgi:CRISPR/Cas system-associated exonuclease Cas4 (RecB family)